MRAPDAAPHPHRAPPVPPDETTGSPSLSLSHSARRDDARPIHPALADADRLRRAESWDAAAAAYETAIDAASTSLPRICLPEAYLRLGYCRRMSGQLTDAAIAYASARATAHALHDPYHTLLSRIGLAVVIATRGNLPRAAEMLEAIVLEAEALVTTHRELTDVIARAKHDRATIAHDRGRPDDAVVDLYDAFHLYSDPSARDRVLIDLARAFADLGLTEVARDALRLCHTQAAESSVRAAAAINLLDLAQRQGEEVTFELLRRALLQEQLVPRHAAYFNLYAGHGLRRFGQHDAATAAFTRARDVAARHGLNEVLLRAEAALASRPDTLDDRVVICDSAAPAVRRVAAGVRAMRATTAGGEAGSSPRW